MKNVYLWYKCNYIGNRLLEFKNNYNYIIPTRSILCKAGFYAASIPNKDFDDRYGVRKIGDLLLQAQGIYHTRKLRSWFWIYYLLSRITVFSSVITHTRNKFVSVFLCLLEGFVIYLLGLYLDRTDIGNKILDYLLSFPKLAVEFLNTYLH